MTRGKYIGIGFLLIAISLIYFAFQLLQASPIKDSLLRDDILRELKLEGHEDDASRPNKEDLQELIQLEHYPRRIDEQSVTTLEGLEHAVNLEELIINFNDIEDLTPLKDLKKLYTLDLSYFPDDHPQEIVDYPSRIKDLEPLGNLTKLKHLHLSNNAITDLTVKIGRAHV